MCTPPVGTSVEINVESQHPVLWYRSRMNSLDQKPLIFPRPLPRRRLKMHGNGECHHFSTEQDSNAMPFIQTLSDSEIDDDVRAMYERQASFWGFIPNYA